MTSELWFESECVVPSYIIILTPGSDLSEFSARYPGCPRRRLDLRWPLENTRLPLQGRSWSPLGPNCPLSSLTLTLASEPCCWRRAPSSDPSGLCLISGSPRCAQTAARCYCPEAGHAHCAHLLCLLPGRSSALPLPRVSNLLCGSLRGKTTLFAGDSTMM